MSDAIHSLFARWTTGLAEVLEAMAGQKPETNWQTAAAPEGDLLWWEQPLSAGPDTTVWVAAPHDTWHHTGAVTLKAAGLDTIDDGEARSTYLEILGQALSSFARAVGGMIGQEVACSSGKEQAPVPPPAAGASIALNWGDAVHTLWIGLSPQLVAAVEHPPDQPEEPETAPRVAAAAAGAVAGSAALSPTMELLLEVELPVSISFGKAELPMRDVLKLTTGSIIELNRGVNEPVEVLVNQCLIARGEVVVVEGNYGVRIQQIASRQDRLRSLR
jgi:flagellar motor switch protein FliN/FliY